MLASLNEVLVPAPIGTLPKLLSTKTTNAKEENAKCSGSMPVTHMTPIGSVAHATAAKWRLAVVPYTFCRLARRNPGRKWKFPAVRLHCKHAT